MVSFHCKPSLLEGNEPIQNKVRILTATFEQLDHREGPDTSGRGRHGVQQVNAKHQCYSPFNAQRYHILEKLTIKRLTPICSLGFAFHPLCL